MASSSATATTPTLFRFSIHTTTSTTNISHTHPVPSFLCRPTPSQQSSPTLQDAFIDVLSVITAQHHSECMAALTSSSCLACPTPASDCLKSPTPFLDLAEPLVIISVYPVCGSKMCEYAVRSRLKEMQVREREKEEEEEKMLFGKVSCDICGKGDARRCAGCGTVGYCGKECQIEGWKKHKRDCGRRLKPNKEGEEDEGKAVGLPYETI